MPFGYFYGFGFWTFSGAPSSAETIYQSMRISQGGADGVFRNDGYADSEMAATAIQLGISYEDSQRAVEQINPDKVSVLLPNMEEQAGIAVDPSLTDATRRKLLKARMKKVPRIIGAEILADLQAVVPTGMVVGVSFPKLSGYPTNVPPTTTQFTPAPNATPSWIRMVGGIGTGTNTFPVELLLGEAPQRGFLYSFIAITGYSNEVVTIINATAAGTSTNGNPLYLINATTTKAHQDLSVASTMSLPYWATGNRRCRVAITQAASQNAMVINLIRDRLERILPAVTVYEFVRTPQDTTFVLDQDKLNLDTL